MDRDWRDSNAPKWVKESAEAELKEWKLTAALSWPTEARPSPVSFSWGEHDHLTGEPSEGTYFSPRSGRVEIKPQDGKTGTTWKRWLFRSEGGKWNTSVVRGPLFTSNRDAELWRLWNECEAAARKLLAHRERL